jgi:gluconokinase
VLVLALDIGSSSTRASLFDPHGRAAAGTGARRNYSLKYTADGGAELSPVALHRAVRACVGETLRSSRARKGIVAVSGSAFWHGLLGLDREGKPATSIFTWADSRCVADAARLRSELDEREIHDQTGCMLRASFWPAKLRWIRRTNRLLFRSVHRWVSPADWIFRETFGTSGTSHSMASATGLYDRRTEGWHSALCQACQIDPGQLDLISSDSQRNGFDGAEIFHPIGDGAAGNLGSDATGSGRVAINIGTSAAVRMVVRGNPRVPFGLFCYAVDRERSAVGGAVSNAGNLYQWCARQLRLRTTEAKALSRSAAANDALNVLPFWVSERAPSWPEKLSGAILGLTQSSDATEILRACTSATFYRLADILELLERKAGHAKQIVVSGGILRSKQSLCILADALGRDISVSSEAEASLHGAAVYVLEKLGRTPAPLPKPKLIRHDRALAAKHRIRRERQITLEKQLSTFLF